MTDRLTTIIHEVPHVSELQNLFGVRDSNLEVLEKQLGVTIVTRGEQFKVTGSEEGVALFNSVYEAILPHIRKGQPLFERDFAYVIELAKHNKLDEYQSIGEEELLKNTKGRSIRPKTIGQKNYVRAIRKNDIVFGIGPAGTGKTYLAVIMAVHYLKSEGIKKIILTRPAVEAGENLGFLPGDLKEKVDPYLRPLYDALHDVLGAEYTNRLIERGTIEIAPLAYMRGRTLDDAFVILDEAQNTTATQMKMFLTRLGFNSKMVITGDPSQIDLPRGARSGLVTAQEVLRDVKGISQIHFQGMDVVRHPLVQKVIEAYDEMKM